MPEGLDLVSLEKILDSIKSMRWQVPLFQRDFIWQRSQVRDLVDSLIEGRPLGMITLWESPPGSSKELFQPFEFLAKAGPVPEPIAGVLDGQQRLTSLLNVFGGCLPPHGLRRLNGRWFLKFDDCPPDERLIFLKEAETKTRKLTTLGECLKGGCIPLSDFAIVENYLAEVRNPAHYDGGNIPVDVEARIDELKRLSRAVGRFRLPVYLLPGSVSLNEVCEIFEYLNTKGTKVSVFDIIHSKHFKQSFDLRKWYKECGQSTSLSGLTGWCSDLLSVTFSY